MNGFPSSIRLLFNNMMHGIAAEQEEDAEDETMRNSRLPDARKDPNVWCIKVANGTEQSVSTGALNKHIHMYAYPHGGLIDFLVS